VKTLQIRQGLQELDGKSTDEGRAYTFKLVFFQ
jgi:hypothetical protein